MGFIGRAVAPSPISENDVPDLPASKITTGTFADARLSSSSVTQHAQSVDLQPVKSDITALALREATNESSASFNLPNQFIDTFATDTLGTKTNVSLLSGYISTISDNMPTGTQLYLKSNSSSNNSTTIADYSGNSVAVSFQGGGKHITQGDVPIGAVTGSASTSAFWFDGSQFISVSHANFETPVNFGTGDFTLATYFRANNASTTTRLFSMGGIGSIADYNGFSWGYYAGSTGMKFHYRESGTNQINISSGSLSLSNDTFYHLAVTRENGVIKFWKDGVKQGSDHNEAYNINMANADSRDFHIGINSDGENGFQGRMDAMHVVKGTALYTGNFTKPTVYYGTSASATGTAIQNTNTVGSAKTKVGGTILYKDNQGTATLGTDLKVYFSCNGGTNWTEASSYSAITPVYSTGVKQVRLGETTCTSGTDVRYKVEWANQSAGSKETQLHGIGTNY